MGRGGGGGGGGGVGVGGGGGGGGGGRGLGLGLVVGLGLGLGLGLGVRLGLRLAEGVSRVGRWEVRRSLREPTPARMPPGRHRRQPSCLSGPRLVCPCSE
jgi:hypothetical protein